MQIEIIDANDLDAKRAVIWQALKAFALSGGGVISCLKDRRSIKMNAKLWPMLQDFSSQVIYMGAKRTKEDWKVILMSAWRITEKGQQPDLLPGLHGEFICLNYSTSKLGKKDFSSFIEFIYATGLTQFSVKFTDPAMQAYSTYKEANI